MPPRAAPDDRVSLWREGGAAPAPPCWRKAARASLWLASLRGGRAAWPHKPHRAAGLRAGRVDDTRQLARIVSQRL